MTASCKSCAYARDADAMLARVLAMALCLSVRLSVTSRCSIEMSGRIELVFGKEPSLDLAYTVLQGN